MNQVLTTALALPRGDRLELAEAILASLEPKDRPPLDESWRFFIERRSQELQAGRVAGIVWSEVTARARNS